MSKDEIKYLGKFKEGKERDYNTLPIQEEEKGFMSSIIGDMKKTMVVPNKKKYKIKRFNKLKVNGVPYEWGYGGYNYDGEYGWRLFIFDNDGKKIYNQEPVDLDDFNTDSIWEIITTL